MTENQEIKILKEEKSWESDDRKIDAFIMAIQALEEIQAYRAIGTVEELEAMKKGTLSAMELADICCVLEDLKKYSAIGTIEEFKALKEKNEPKKPIDLSTVKDGDSYYYIGRCPRCKDLVSEDDIVCEECHQVLDWS